MKILISIVVPVYNEEKNIIPFLQRTVPVVSKLDPNYEVIFALDPSSDKTEEVILKEIDRNHHIKLILFSRRFGQPAATMAGIFASHGEACVVIDVDLQDQPELIVDMYKKLKLGYEVVYAKRITRKGETFLKKIISSLGYTVINKLCDVQIPRNTGDFRIISRRVIEELRRLNESHGFLRGLVAYVGFKQTFIEYDRDERYSGKGNYNRLTGSLKIGLNGLIGFSSKPLFAMSICGFVVAFLSFCLGSWYLLQKIIGINITPGLSTTVILIAFFAGIQLLGLGLIGEYVGRIYDEVKRRPLYIIDRKINFKDKS
jgi:glycosyltransferase involved in cell wall biosynthesis